MSFDLHIESLPPEEVVGTYCLTFGDYERSLAVRGVQKMVNRFIKCFLTPIGTDLSDPDYGTPLAGAFLGNIDPETLHSLAARSVAAAEAKIKEYDAEYELPDDERLAHVRINRIYTNDSGRGVFLNLTLKNAAGLTVAALMPQIAG